MKKTIFTGAGVAIVTPMNPDESINFDRLGQIIDSQIENGTDAIVICGTTGESATMTDQEHVDCIEYAVKRVNGRVPVVAGAGSNHTSYAVWMSKEAKRVGADALLHVTPYYNKTSQTGLIRHFNAVADATDLPIILYNIPGRCAVNMTAETSLRLAHDLDNVVAIKEASGSFEQVKAIVEGAPEGFCVYSGDDSATYDIMKLGGVGVISTIGNVAPARMKVIVELCAAGKWEEAAAANERLMPLMEGLFKTANPILVKEALKLAGFPVGGVRLPLVNATAEQSAELERTMREVGVL